ncbi:MAG: hypothetical protein O2849_06555 [Proteobacteria bacterium]|nr:hypothetical protein [Pseudomonadota bacterium]
MSEQDFEKMIVNHYMTIYILTKAFNEQIEATLNIKCSYCDNLIFSDNPTFDMCIDCADKMEDLALLEEE